jgi:primosomal protein N' (replication factor Y)
VELHGRRVGGWVVATGVEPETDTGKLRPIAKVVGDGPPADVLDLCRWAAWRWCGPEVLTMRAASPPNAVRDVVVTRPEPPRPGHRVEALAWPPAADRRELVASRLAPVGSTVVVVPEGARLGSLLRRLAAEGRPVHVLRADQPDAERTRSWAAARRGGCVVVGGRTAVWAPVPDLAAVVVLDESDEALQEERVPTWHARDVAIERARRAGAPVLLVGAAPTLDARVAAGGVVARPARDVEREGWPIVEIVDRRDEPPGLRLLTEPLSRALHRAIDGGGRAVCVLNRKGRARLLVCAECHTPARCERCGTAVVEVDDDPSTLVCPRCETARPHVCLVCHASRLRVVRAGVSRLRDDLAALLPRASVAEVESTTEEVPVADLLVGTEAVLHRIPKGPPVGLVAFLEVDQELLAPRIRVAEQALTLLARAARVLGPRSRGGRLLVQTRVPDHPVLLAAVDADTVAVLDAEEETRRALGAPPFGGLAEVSGEPPAVGALADELRAVLGVSVLGPSPAGPTTSRALVRAPDPAALADVLGLAVPSARALGRLRVAVDPPRV